MYWLPCYCYNSSPSLYLWTTVHQEFTAVFQLPVPVSYCPILTFMSVLYSHFNRWLVIYLRICHWYWEGGWSVGLGTWCTACQDHYCCDIDGTTVETQTSHRTGLQLHIVSSVWTLGILLYIVYLVLASSKELCANVYVCLMRMVIHVIEYVW